MMSELVILIIVIFTLSAGYMVFSIFVTDSIPECERCHVLAIEEATNIWCCPNCGKEVCK
jgi:hypothetical protein